MILGGPFGAGEGGARGVCPFDTSALRLLGGLRWSSLFELPFKPADPPMCVSWLTCSFPAAVFTLPFWPFSGSFCGAVEVSSVDGIAGEVLTGSRKDYMNERKRKEEIVGDMRREQEAAHCEP